jgi:hypothetical protein
MSALVCVRSGEILYARQSTRFAVPLDCEARATASAKCSIAGECGVGVILLHESRTQSIAVLLPRFK